MEKTASKGRGRKRTRRVSGWPRCKTKSERTKRPATRTCANWTISRGGWTPCFASRRSTTGWRQGRAQFLPLDTVRHVYPLNLQKERGVVGVAAKLVRCENQMRPLVDTLLGRVIIVEDIETGLRMIRRSLGSVVTLDGIFIEQTGVIAGGTSGAE